MKWLLLILILIPIHQTKAQEVEKVKSTSPGMAFLKSAIFPGWGHLSLGNEHKTRAYTHMGAEIVLLVSYFGISSRNVALQQNMYAHVAQNAQTSIKGRDRAYQLAVGQFSSLQAYNAYQELNRNWAAYLDDIPANRWQWSSDQAQADYIRIRNEIDSNEQQLPFLVSAMIGNRVLSGISAFIRARNQLSIQADLSIVPISTNRAGLALHIGF